MTTSTSSLHSLASQSSLSSSFRLDSTTVGEGKSSDEVESNRRKEGLVSQVIQWLREEKAKRASHKSSNASKHKNKANKAPLQSDGVSSPSQQRHVLPSEISSSESSEGDLALERLEKILTQNMDLANHDLKPSSSLNVSPKATRLPRRRSSAFRKLRRSSVATSSDTDYVDGDVLVPSCDVVLDNSKLLSRRCVPASAHEQIKGGSNWTSKDQEAWATFKGEVVRLAHTLRLKGWRSVPLDRGAEVDIERLSGALTNAVYVVSPPKDLKSSKATNNGAQGVSTYRPPQELLLRIYGPQVEHLIDRDKELQILRRLARKSIGPRMLGTFSNGRFEEFFNAQTLTDQDLRVPETSQHIGKRMRELHDGIELLEEERDAGPTVWINWDKWVDRAEQVVCWTDRQIKTTKRISTPSSVNAWRNRGLVCGVEWPLFRRTVERYREWLDKTYGGVAGIRQQLVFAHNDTQYGNILRLKPSGHSPLLLPANQHKQLVVIDFEYASANLPGLEFANHFTEWCYNYHDPKRPFTLNSARYPSPEEQRHFIRAYVDHRSRSQRPSRSPSSTTASSIPSRSISAFMLDSRVPTAQIIEDEDRQNNKDMEEVELLMRDTRLWRVANSAQWVIWGVVQANIPEMTSGRENSGPAGQEGGSLEPVAENPSPAASEGPSQNTPEGETSNEDDDEGDFDYLGYAQERAMLFWGDIVSLGIVSRNDLPKELLPKLKIIGC
ncbi:MAG: hypothetical protein M1833_006995 [Piccolia ochrophora]|nr:MAG: hypothetical protein M1833_006995 [Piccolia ochrophora]